jgi:hypothetical protein
METKVLDIEETSTKLRLQGMKMLKAVPQKATNYLPTCFRSIHTSNGLRLASIFNADHRRYPPPSSLDSAADGIPWQTGWTRCRDTPPQTCYRDNTTLQTRQTSCKHHGRVRLGGDRPVLLWHVKSEQLLNQSYRGTAPPSLYRLRAGGRESALCSLL